MRIVASSSPLTPPLLDSGDVNVLEIRNNAGKLVRLLVFMPDGTSFLEDDDSQSTFEEFCKNMGVPMLRKTGQAA